MIEALNKINNLELLTKSDMANIIFSLKKKFNLEGYLNKIKFYNISNYNMIMSYEPDNKCININNNADEHYFIHFLDAVSRVNFACIEESWIDFRNLDILYILYHEIYHVLQAKVEDLNSHVLYKYSIRLLNNNLYLYDKYWSFFYFDYNANIRAMKSVLSLIDSGYIKVNKNSIYLINMHFARDLLKSYGISFTEKNKTCMNLTYNSPIMFMNKNKYRLVYDSKMDYIALNNSIKKALNESNLINRINLGSPLSCDIINTLILISLGKIKTSNIFNLVENGNKKIKKLSK